MFDSLRTAILRLLVALAERWPWLGTRVNAFLINRIVGAARTRPHPWSTVHDYVSWSGLTDQSYSARHLPAYRAENLPDAATLRGVFARKDGEGRLCPKSTCLFPTFAQYLTDGFIRTRMSHDDSDRLNVRQNTSNHQIDLCPLYGRTRDQTLALRLRSEEPGRKGRLRSQMLDTGEYAPFLYAGDAVNPDFEVLDPPLGIDGLQKPEKAGQRAHLFAFGGDRANSVPQVAMLNTLLLREHNRLAGELEQRNPDRDDTWVFETARNIVIVEFIKIVVEDYINHIAPSPFRLRADPSVAWRAPWNKPNWITAEFSLLYRWHALVPDTIRWGDKTYRTGSTFMDNRPLVEVGLAQGFADMSAQRAGALGPFNTTAALLGVEERSITQGRICELAPYAAYRRYMGLSAPERFEDISSNEDVVAFLRDAYRSPEDVEFFVGLFTEDTVANSPLPELVLRMVALDAFSQALTNPLLSEHVFRPETFTTWGWDQIAATAKLRDLVARNVPQPLGDAVITMTRPGWAYAW